MPLSLTDIIGMLVRRTPVNRMRKAYKRVEREGLPITLWELEAHHLAGGNVEELIAGALYAQQKGLPHNIEALRAAQIAGEDLEGFIDRGYVLQSELHRQELWDRAPRERSAAAELVTLLTKDLGEIEEGFSHLDNMPGVARQALEPGRLEELRSHLMQRKQMIEEQVNRARKLASRR